MENEEMNTGDEHQQHLDEVKEMYDSRDAALKLLDAKTPLNWPTKAQGEHEPNSNERSVTGGASHILSSTHDTLTAQCRASAVAGASRVGVQPLPEKADLPNENLSTPFTELGKMFEGGFRPGEIAIIGVGHGRPTTSQKVIRSLPELLEIERENNPDLSIGVDLASGEIKSLPKLELLKYFEKGNEGIPKMEHDAPVIEHPEDSEAANLQNVRLPDTHTENDSGKLITKSVRSEAMKNIIDKVKAITDGNSIEMVLSRGGTISSAQAMSMFNADNHLYMPLSTGLQDVDDMFGSGIRAGHFGVVFTDGKQRISPLTIAMFKGFCLHNKAQSRIPGKKPLIMHITFDDKRDEHLKNFSGHLPETQEQDFTAIEPASDLFDSLEVGGYTAMICVYKEGVVSIDDMINELTRLEKEGYELHGLIIENLYRRSLPLRGVGDFLLKMPDAINKLRLFCLQRNAVGVFTHPAKVACRATTVDVGDGRDDQLARPDGILNRLIEQCDFALFTDSALNTKNEDAYPTVVVTLGKLRSVRATGDRQVAYRLNDRRELVLDKGMAPKAIGVPRQVSYFDHDRTIQN